MAEPSKKVMSDVRPRSLDGMVRKAPAADVQQSSVVASRPGDIVQSGQAKPAQTKPAKPEAVEQPAKLAKPKKPLGKRVVRWVITVLILLVVAAIAAGVWIIYINFFR